MRKILHLLIFTLMLFVVSSQSFARSAPAGSYQHSCRHIKIKRHRVVYYNLYATCRTRDGRWVRSKLKKYRRCNQDIANINGYLRCVPRRHAHRPHRPLPPVHRDGHPPYGSYKRSCRNIHAHRYTLTATCRTRRGYWNRTRLANYRNCRRDIKNINGHLHCGWRSTRRYTGYVPRGSYQYSCRNAYVNNHNLIATCRTRSGHWNRTRLLDYRRCRQNITNINGRLYCGRRTGIDLTPHRHGRIPRGSYQRSCRNVYVRHLNLIATCRTYSGHWNRSKLYDYRYCRGDISNINGRLSCRR